MWHAGFGQAWAWFGGSNTLLVAILQERIGYFQLIWHFFANRCFKQVAQTADSFYRCQICISHRLGLMGLEAAARFALCRYSLVCFSVALMPLKAQPWFWVQQQ
jgi:hypothetical protein